jgi:hypothetical protein
VVIFCVAATLALAAVSTLYSFYYRGQKSRYLEALMEELFEGGEEGGEEADGWASPDAAGRRGGRSLLPSQFLQSLQQSLVLKDVLVNYAELRLEAAVGEGNFGVVHRAWFRGAQAGG